MGVQVAGGGACVEQGSGAGRTGAFVLTAGQKAGLSGVGFEPMPPEETVIRIQCLRQLGHPSLSLYKGFLK